MVIHQPQDERELQLSLDSMVSGDEVHLRPNRNYMGPFYIRSRSSGGTITTAGYTLQGTIPFPDESHSRICAERNDRALVFEDKAHDVTLRGVHFRGIAGESGSAMQSLLVEMNPGLDIQKCPRRIYFEECMFSGAHWAKFTREGLRFNACDSYVKHCRFENFRHHAEAYAINSYTADNCAIYASSLSASGIPLFVGVGNHSAESKTPSRMYVALNDIRMMSGQGLGSKHAIEVKGGNNLFIHRNKIFNVTDSPVIGDPSCIYLKTNYSPIHSVHIRENKSVNSQGYFLQVVSQPLETPFENEAMQGIVAIDNDHECISYNRNRLLRIARGGSSPVNDVIISNLRGTAPAQPNMDVSLDGQRPCIRSLSLYGVSWEGWTSRYGIKGGGEASGDASLSAYCQNWVVSPDALDTNPPVPHYPIMDVLDGGSPPPDDLAERVAELEVMLKKLQLSDRDNKQEILRLNAELAGVLKRGDNVTLR